MPPFSSTDTDSSLKATSSRGGWFRGAADYGLVFLVFLVAGGDQAPGVNEPHYLTRLKNYWDPDWVRGDLFLDSPDAHLTVVLLFGWTTLWLPLPAVAWLGRLVSWVVLAWAWRRLSWRVMPILGVAALSAALWCVGVRSGNLAGEWVVGGFEAKCLAWALVVAALGSYLRDEWNLVWCFLGAASAMHVLVGGWSVVLLGGAWLLQSRKTTSLASMAPGLTVGGLLALAGIVPPLLMNAGTPPEVTAEGARIYVYERLPHHLALLSMPPEWLRIRLLSHATVLALLTAVTVWVRQQSDAEPIRRLCLFAWGAVGLACVGLVLESALAGAPLQAAGLLRYYWFRMTDVVAPLAASIGIVAWITHGIATRKDGASIGLAAALLVVAVSFGQSTVARLGSPPPADAKMGDYAEWRDVCKWAAEQTPPHSLFLTPRSSNSFTWRAGRPEVVAHKHIPQNSAGLVEWWQRMNDVHRSPHDPELWTASPGQLGAARLRELADSYGVDYVLSDRRWPVSLPVAYRNRFYVVYDLRPFQTEPTP